MAATVETLEKLERRMTLSLPLLRDMPLQTETAKASMERPIPMSNSSAKDIV